MTCASHTMRHGMSVLLVAGGGTRVAVPCLADGWGAGVLSVYTPGGNYEREPEPCTIPSPGELRLLGIVESHCKEPGCTRLPFIVEAFKRL